MTTLYDWQSLAPVTFGKMISDNDPEYPQSTMEVRLNGHVVGWITQLRFDECDTPPGDGEKVYGYHLDLDLIHVWEDDVDTQPSCAKFFKLDGVQYRNKMWFPNLGTRNCHPRYIKTKGNYRSTQKALAEAKGYARYFCQQHWPFIFVTENNILPKFHKKLYTVPFVEPKPEPKVKTIRRPKGGRQIR